MQRLLVFVLLVLMSFCHCRAQTAAAQKHSSPQTTEAALVISFYSIGTGVNGEAYDNVLAAIKKHNKQNHTRLRYEEIHWGREGERDLCFPAQNSRNFKLFIKQMEQKCAAYEHVRLAKNTPCRK